MLASLPSVRKEYVMRDSIQSKCLFLFSGQQRVIHVWIIDYDWLCRVSYIELFATRESDRHHLKYVEFCWYLDLVKCVKTERRSNFSDRTVTFKISYRLLLCHHDESFRRHITNDFNMECHKITTFMVINTSKLLYPIDPLELSQEVIECMTYVM